MEHESKEREMSAVAQVTLREYAGRRWPALNHKGRIGRLSGHLQMGFRRVRSLYHNEPGVRLRADEMAAIEALRQTQIEEANNHAFQDLQARIARLEAALLQSDPEFFHDQMAGLRQASGSGRGENVTRTDETEGAE